MPRSPESEKDPLIGKKVGSYDIISSLGKGGMGAVYRGEHPQIESKVAIKVLLPRFVESPEIVRRFFDEARAVNRIGHPGIVRIHDCNHQDDVGVYLVMELLEGQTLQDRFQRLGPLPPAMVARQIQQAASALSASHEAGIIHRDLKLANVFVVPDPDMPGGERVKILDFGIAKLLEDHEPLGDGGTKTGMVIGSPMYMSPEQCIDSKSVDLRSDIYSLGAIAYRLLSGVFPFEADTLGRLIIMHHKQQAAPLCQIKPTIPEALSDVIGVALETDRDQRYADMAEFRGALLDLAASHNEDPPSLPVPVEAPMDREDQPVDQDEADAPLASESAEELFSADTMAAPQPLGLKETTLSATSGEAEVPAPPAPARNSKIWVFGGLTALALVLVVVLVVRGTGDPPAPSTATAGSSSEPPATAGSSAKSLPATAKQPPATPRDPRPVPPVQPRTTTARDAHSAAAREAATATTTNAPATGDTVKITLKLHPAGAKVLLDGKPTTDNPLLLPADGKTRKILVMANRYLPQKRVFVPEKDRTFNIRLRKWRPRQGRGPRKNRRGPYFHDLD